MSTFFNGYDGLLCDLDGVVYTGNVAIETSVTVLNALTAQGIPVAFVTNNASRSTAQVAKRLASFGVHTDVDHVITSACAVVDALKTRYQPSNGPVLVAGSEQLQSQVSAAGFDVTASSAGHPQVVIQGFSPKLSWQMLAEASFAIQNGAGWLASNLDLTIPLAQGVAPGNGSFVNVVAQATGKRPALSAGKPAPTMFTMMAKRFSMKHPLVVGDRLDTDVLGATRAEFHSALIETGIHRRADLLEFQDVATPDWILPDLTPLLDVTNAEHGDLDAST